VTTPAEREIVHIAGLDVRVGPHLRQRCAWCGAIIEDVDLSTIQVQVVPGEETPSYPTWQVGALIGRSGGATYVIAHNDGDQLPPNSCASVDPAATT